MESINLNCEWKAEFLSNSMKATVSYRAAHCQSIESNLILESISMQFGVTINQAFHNCPVPSSRFEALGPY